MPRQPRACTSCGQIGMWRTFTCRTCTRRTKNDGTLVPSSDASWRPRHFPPPCPACNGWAYTQRDRDHWQPCRACRRHPGHAMTFADWDLTRATAGKVEA